MGLIRIIKSRIVCPMSLTLVDPRTKEETRRVECCKPRGHLGYCTDGHGSVWQMPKKFLDRLEKEMKQENREARNATQH